MSSLPKMATEYKGPTALGCFTSTRWLMCPHGRTKRIRVEGKYLSFRVEHGMRSFDVLTEDGLIVCTELLDADMQVTVEVREPWPG